MCSLSIYRTRKILSSKGQSLKQPSSNSSRYGMCVYSDPFTQGCWVCAGICHEGAGTEWTATPEKGWCRVVYRSLNTNVELQISYSQSRIFLLVMPWNIWHHMTPSDTMLHCVTLCYIRSTRKSWRSWSSRRRNMTRRWRRLVSCNRRRRWVGAKGAK